MLRRTTASPRREKRSPTVEAPARRERLEGASPRRKTMAPEPPQRKKLWLYAAGGAVVLGLAIALGARSSTGRLDALERRAAATQHELERTQTRLAETTRAFESYREQHAIVVTDESLQEDVRRALDVVARTTKASEARQNATVEALIRTVHEDVDRQTAADDAKTSLVIEKHDASWLKRASLFNGSLDSAQRNMLAASTKATARSVAMIADAATSAALKAQKAKNASDAAASNSQRAAQRLQATTDRANNIANRLEKGLTDTINRTATKAIRALDAQEKRHEVRLAASTKDLETAAQTITARVAASELEVKRNEERNDGRFARQNTLLRVWISGFFALFATILTLRHVYAHATQMARPDAQRKVLAILWMVPIYALCSWLAIVLPNIAQEVLLVSSFYEAYCVHMFFSFLVAVLGNGHGEHAALDELPASLEAPCSLCGRVWVPGRTFLEQCKLGTLQFVILKPFLSVLDYALDDGSELIDYTSAAFWILVLLNVSVSIALTALLKFFHATHLSPRLRAYRPWPKFLAVKGVVFMTWFQGVAIQLAVRFDVLGSDSALSDRSAALAFQNFLVCVEMFLAALAHAHIFGADEWQPDYVPVHLHASVADNLALNDFLKDFRSVLPKRLRRIPEGEPAPPADGSATLLEEGPRARFAGSEG